jgi:hypothetical protein
MLPFIVFLAIAMIVLGLIGTMVKGLFVLTVVAIIFLGLTIIVGGWTLVRRRDRV